MAPCNGVKVCSAPDCSHVQPLNSKKNLCTKHSATSTSNTRNCPVMFMYFFPQNIADDNRRYVVVWSWLYSYILYKHYYMVYMATLIYSYVRVYIYIGGLQESRSITYHLPKI